MSSMEEIDLGGDTRLVVGPEGKQTRLLVSKDLLCVASRYFKSLFKSQYQEASQAEAGEDVRLKDDDVAACTLLMTLLHWRYGARDPPSSPKLLALALIADKYDCVEALRPLVDFLFKNSLDADLLRGATTYNFASAAYVLDCPTLFEKFTKILVLHHTESFATIARSDAAALIPAFSWLQLESRRSTLTRKLMNTINDLTRVPCLNACKQCADWSQKLLAQLRIRGLVDCPWDSLCDIMQKAKKLEVPTFSASGSSRGFASGHTSPLSDADFRYRIEALVDNLQGLCLDCARCATNGSKSYGKCRISHD